MCEQANQFVLMTMNGYFFKAHSNDETRHSLVPQLTANVAKAAVMDLHEARYVQELIIEQNNVVTFQVKARSTVLLDVDDDARFGFVYVALANAFSRKIIAFIDNDAKFAALLKANEETKGCNSNDYCDANEAMIQSFERVMGREVSLQDSEDVRLMDVAWNAAKTNFFAEIKGIDVHA